MSKVLWVDGHLGLNCSICLSKGTYQQITIAYLRGERSSGVFWSEWMPKIVDKILGLGPSKLIVSRLCLTHTLKLLELAVLQLTSSMSECIEYNPNLYCPHFFGYNPTVILLWILCFTNREAGGGGGSMILKLFKKPETPGYKQNQGTTCKHSD